MLKGKNIVLRALEPEDLDLLFAWENNSDIWPMSNTLAPFSRKVIKDYLEHAHLDIYAAKQLRLMICLGDGTAIGTIDLFDFDPQNLRAGIGILIAEELHRKNGYAMEALQVMKNYASEKLNLHQLYCTISATNLDSIKLFEKNNFIRCGIKQEWMRTPKGFVDEYIFQCIF